MDTLDYDFPELLDSPHSPPQSPPCLPPPPPPSATDFVPFSNVELRHDYASLTGFDYYTWILAKPPAQQRFIRLALAALNYRLWLLYLPFVDAGDYITFSILAENLYRPFASFIPDLLRRHLFFKNF